MMNAELDIRIGSKRLDHPKPFFTQSNPCSAHWLVQQRTNADRFGFVDEVHLPSQENTIIRISLQANKKFNAIRISIDNWNAC